MADNILIIANSSSGLYGFRHELIEKILEEHDVAISVPDGANINDLCKLTYNIILTDIDRRGINPVTDMALFFKYLRILKSVRPELVISFTIKPNIYGCLACRIKRVPHAANITGLGTAFQGSGLLRKLVTFMYKSALKRAKVVFFENSANRQTFIDARIVPEHKCCLLNGAGVNLEHYAYQEYPISETTRFLFVGRVMREKGIDELLSAMRRLRNDGANCVLDVLGSREEDYADTLHRCEIEGWLNYHGYQMDVRPFIQKAHCFVLPSYHEGMANTNLECAAMGRPIITSDIPGCREAVIPGESGLLCQPHDADSLYHAMKEFLALTAEERREMGKCGRKHMENVFDKNKVVKATLERLF